VGSLSKTKARLEREKNEGQLEIGKKAPYVPRRETGAEHKILAQVDQKRENRLREIPLQEE